MLGLGCVALALRAATGNNNPTSDETNRSEVSRFDAISQRNIFDLTPIPPIEPPKAADTNPPPPNVTLIGLSTILGSDQAIFILKPQAARASAQPNSEETIVMNVGERHGVLELLAMNMKDGTARIRNEGAESTITIRTNAPSGGGVAGAGGRPTGNFSQPPPGFPSPAQGGYNPKAGGYNPAASNYNPPAAQPQANAGSESFVNPYSSGAAGQNMYGSSGATAPATSFTPTVAPNVSPTGDPTGIPSRDIRTPPALSPDEQTLMIEAQRQNALQTGDPIAIILPPTELTPGQDNGGNGQQQSGSAPPPMPGGRPR